VDAQAELERYKDSLALAENRLDRAKRDAALTLEARAEELAKELARSNKPYQESEPKQSDIDGSDVQVRIPLKPVCIAGMTLLKRMLLRRTV
jgi:hypothetical protein